METTDDITTLLQMAEERFGQSVASPAAFEALADAIFRDTRQPISVSTLKRLWGYVPSDSRPRLSTLDTLSCYVGFSDFKAFSAAAAEGMLPQSDFHECEILKATSLTLGDEVQLEWLPDRRCRLRCVGVLRFQVVEAANSKLSAGDTFTASVFAKGQPLEAVDVDHAGARIESYVAGRTNGLTKIERIDGSRH